MNFQKKLMLIICITALVASMFAPLTAVIAQSSSSSLFDVTIIAPGNANLLRRQWADIFASNLDQLGINAKVVYLDWTSVYDRCLTPATDLVGKTWDQGGWDVLALWLDAWCASGPTTRVLWRRPIVLCTIRTKLLPLEQRVSKQSPRYLDNIQQ